VGLQKDQPYFSEDLEGIEKTNLLDKATLDTKNITLQSQTQKAPEEGPKFDFLAPSVLLAEEALRQAVTKLKAILEVFSQDISQIKGYLTLARELDHLIPELYFHYDAFVKVVLETGEEKVTCARACSHCCSHYVTSVEPYELLFLHGKIRTDNRYPGQLISFHRRVTLFRSLLKGGFDDNEQAADEDKALYRYYLRGQPCPFLSEGGACGIYENRPMSCRMFYSLSHPSLCKGKSVIAPGNRNFLIELPEDIEADLARAGLLFAKFDLPESLFEGLLSVNETFGQFDHGEAEPG
jgi:Fe-S-cluster containining protein